MIVTNINSSISNGSQTVDYFELLTIGKIRFQLRIRSDSHKSQSHANIERWNGDRWQGVSYLNTGEMQTEHGLRYGQHNNPVTSKDFKSDRNELVRRAVAICEA